jgi:hypothetical protein
MPIWYALLIRVVLTTGTVWPVVAREAQPEAADQSVMPRLQYATFDLQRGKPRMPSTLHTDVYRSTARRSEYNHHPGRRGAVQPLPA